MQVLLLTSFAVRALSKVSSPTCFIKSHGPFGSELGSSFDDAVVLNQDFMTTDMRISAVNVCTDPASHSLQGLQLSLTDNKTLYRKTLDPVGSVKDSANCASFEINTTTDWLRYVSIWYDATGIHALQLETFKGRQEIYGNWSATKQPDSSLIKQLWGLSLYDDAPKFAFVGLAGTHQPGEKITSL